MTIKAKRPLKKIESAQATRKTAAAAPAVKREASKTRRVTLHVRADLGSRVFVAGSFNGWDPAAKRMADKKGDGIYTATLNLPPGLHPYKFVINGTWCADPACAETVQNGHGMANSLLRL